MQLSTSASVPKLSLRTFTTMNAMIRILVVAGLVSATFAALPEFKTCDANKQSVNAFSQAVITADTEFDVYSSAFIDAKVQIKAASDALSSATADGIAAVSAQAGRGKCVDAEISTEAAAIAETIATASAAITAVVKAEAEAFASVYLSLFAYSQAAAESCSCPENSDAVDESLTTASSDLVVRVSSEAQEFFKSNVEVKRVSNAWSSAISDCNTTPKFCRFRNRITSQAGGSCRIRVGNLDCSKVKSPAVREKFC